MDLTIGVNSSFFRNYKRSRIFDDDMFSVFINGKEVRYPLFLVTMLSSEISKLINKDSTLRTFNINIQFRSQKSKEKIINILESGQQGTNEKIENDEEVLDFADFGSSFGCEMFVKPFESFVEKLKKEGINENNAINIIESKDFISRVNDKESCIDQEIEYISSNFSAFCDKERFIEWSKRKENEERVEQIIGNKKFHLNKEDDLFYFIMNINKDENRFINLFSYVHLEFCTAGCCKQLIEMIRKNDILQSRNYRDSILECINRKLLYGTNIDPNKCNVNSRYPESFIETIKKNSFPISSNDFEKPMKDNLIKENEKVYSKRAEKKNCAIIKVSRKKMLMALLH